MLYRDRTATTVTPLYLANVVYRIYTPVVHNIILCIIDSRVILSYVGEYTKYYRHGSHRPYVIHIMRYILLKKKKYNNRYAYLSRAYTMIVIILYVVL